VSAPLILEGPAVVGVGNSDAAGDALYAANHNDTFAVVGQANSADTVYGAANSDQRGHAVLGVR
jgi:hypothetical protein